MNVPARVGEPMSSRFQLLEAISEKHGPQQFDKQLTYLLRLRARIANIGTAVDPEGNRKQASCSPEDRFMLDKYKAQAAVTKLYIETVMRTYETPSMVKVDVTNMSTADIIKSIIEGQPDVKADIFGGAWNADPDFCKQELPVPVGREGRSKGTAQADYCSINVADIDSMKAKAAEATEGVAGIGDIKVPAVKGSKNKKEEIPE